MKNEQSGCEHRPAGGVLSDAAQLMLNRAEMGTLELAEIRDAAGRAVLGACAVAVFAVLALGAFGAAFAFATWETLHWHSLLLVGTVYLTFGAAFAVLLKRMLERRPLWAVTTLGELEADIRALRGESP